MNRLTQYSCADFTQMLASKAPVPGGGGAAAMAATLGAALCSMAGNYTCGKKKYAAVEEDMQRILRECDALRIRLLELVELDAESFEPLSKAYAIPKEDPCRQQVMDAASLNACQPPLEMVICCAKAIVLLEEMMEKGSRMFVSDIGCGALLCRAAMESAALMVFVNTASMKDRTAADRLEHQVDEALSTCLPLAERIAADAMAYIRKEP